MAQIKKYGLMIFVLLIALFTLLFFDQISAFTDKHGFELQKATEPLITFFSIMITMTFTVYVLTLFPREGFIQKIRKTRPFFEFRKHVRNTLIAAASALIFAFIVHLKNFADVYTRIDYFLISFSLPIFIVAALFFIRMMRAFFVLAYYELDEH